MALPHLLRRLESGFDSLKLSSDIKRIDRHRSITACSAVSFRGLADGEKLLLGKLGFFPAGCGYELIDVVMHGSDWDEFAANLVDASLVRQAHDRYTIHPVIRHMIVGRSVNGMPIVSGNELATDLLEYATKIGERTLPENRNSKDRTRALDWIELEWQNIVACVRICLTNGHEGLVCELSDQLRDFFYVRGYLQECEDLYDQVLAIRRRTQDTKGVMRTLYCLGLLYESKFDNYEAAKRYIASVALANGLADRRWEAIALYGLAIACTEIARTEQGKDQLEHLFAGSAGSCIPPQPEDMLAKSVSLLEDYGDDVYLGIALSYQAAFYERERRWVDAERVYKRSLNMKRRCSDKEGEGITLLRLGNLYLSSARFRDAEQMFRESMKPFEEMHDKGKRGSSLRALAYNLFQQGKWGDAELSYREAQSMIKDLNNPLDEGLTKHGLGQICLELGDWTGADDLFSSSARIFHELENAQWEATACRSLSMLRLLQRRLESARTLCEESIDLHKNSGDALGKADSMVTLAVVLCKEGHAGDAERLCRDGIRIFEEEHNSYRKARALVELSEILRITGRLADAEEAALAALGVFRECFDLPDEARARSVLARIYQDSERWGESDVAYAKAISIFDSLKSIFRESRLLLSFSRSMLARGRLQDAFDWAKEAVSDLEQTEDLATLRDARELEERLNSSTIRSSAAVALVPITSSADERDAGRQTSGREGHSASLSGVDVETFDCFLSHNNRD
jgi:tetratricopeptide (TPR) repeat protein